MIKLLRGKTQVLSCSKPTRFHFIYIDVSFGLTSDLTGVPVHPKSEGQGLKGKSVPFLCSKIIRQVN